MSVTASKSPSFVPFVPESAPFTAAQRAWLNGFLAGMLGSAAPSVAPASIAATAEVEEFPWHDSALPLDERMKLAEGRTPARLLMAAMAQLDCGSCGYVCQTYAEAIASGADADLTKCSPGGKATAKKLKEIAATLTIGGEPMKMPAVVPNPDAGGSPIATRDRPATGRLLRNVKLNGADSAKDTRHIEIDLRGTNVTYKPGDALGIWPENDLDLVEAILHRIGATGAEDVSSLDGSHTSLFEGLRRQRVITAPSESLVELLIGQATDAAEASALQQALVDESGQPFSGLHVLDLLERAPSAAPTPQQLVDALGRLQPRLYSISSSPAAHAGQVHLTVGAVRYTNAAGRACHGVGSTYLADRVRPGEPIRLFVHDSKHFALPNDPAVPIIMVGPGTGIAPFRAFLHHRRSTAANGKTWLFFGDQRSGSDFLYRDELERMLGDGSLTNLDVAFSRDQTQKVYVQDRMRQRAADLWKWIDGGAHFYVCGDAKRMAKDVDDALVQIVAQQSGCGMDDGRAFVKKLAKDGRYQRDVY